MPGRRKLSKGGHIASVQRVDDYELRSDQKSCQLKRRPPLLVQVAGRNSYLTWWGFGCVLPLLI